MTSKRDYLWLSVAALAGAFAIYCSGLLVVNTGSATEGDYSAAWMVSGFLVHSRWLERLTPGLVGAS